MLISQSTVIAFLSAMLRYLPLIQGYASQWNFTSNKQLLLDNQANRFYAKQLQTTFYNYPAVHWLFGSNGQSINATAITLWRYDP
jgi:hypothetical protein